MLWTLAVFAYVGIAALFFNMSVKEYRAKEPKDVGNLVLSGLACAVWPVIAVLLLLAVNLSSTASRTDRTA